MGVEGHGEIAMDKSGPTGGQPTAGARTIEKEDAGAGGQAKLLMRSVAVWVRMKVDPESGDEYPSKEPNQLACADSRI